MTEWPEEKTPYVVGARVEAERCSCPTGSEAVGSMHRLDCDCALRFTLPEPPCTARACPTCTDQRDFLRRWACYVSLKEEQFPDSLVRSANEMLRHPACVTEAGLQAREVHGMRYYPKRAVYTHTRLHQERRKFPRGPFPRLQAWWGRHEATVALVVIAALCAYVAWGWW